MSKISRIASIREVFDENTIEISGTRLSNSDTENLKRVMKEKPQFDIKFKEEMVFEKQPKEIDELRQTVNRLESKCNILSSQTGTMYRIIEKLYEEIETLKKQIG